MSYKIITHNGKAHIDELLATALVVIHREEEPETIDRIDSQEVARMVRTVAEPDLSAEDIIRQALQSMIKK